MSPSQLLVYWWNCWGSFHSSHHCGGGTNHLNCVMEMDLCWRNWYKLDQTGLINSLFVSHSVALRHHQGRPLEPVAYPLPDGRSWSHSGWHAARCLPHGHTPHPAAEVRQCNSSRVDARMLKLKSLYTHLLTTLIGTPVHLHTHVIIWSDQWCGGSTMCKITHIQVKSFD